MLTGFKNEDGTVEPFDLTPDQFGSEDNGFGYTADDFLLGLLVGVEVPHDEPNNDSAELTLDCRDGWKVVVFYDCGSLDYIDSFITPENAVVRFWDWPDSQDKQTLINWRG